MNTPLKLSPVLYHNQQKAARMICSFYKLCLQAAIQVGQANWGNVTQFIGQRPVRIPPGRIKKRKNRRETESSSVVYWPCREGDRVKEQILAVQRMQDYIDQHLFETVTLAELARQPCFPRGTRTGSLKPVPGYPPADYIRKLRLSKSALRLRDEAKKARKCLLARPPIGYTETAG